MVTVYVIKSLKNNSLYVGMTEDIERRIKEHNSGKSKYTSGFMPWIVLYSEQTLNWEEGRKREKYLKSTAGKVWLRKNHKI